MIETPAQVANRSIPRENRRRPGALHLTDRIRLLLLGPQLDARIAAGEDPARDALLAHRARRLVSRRSRRRLVQGLERTLAPPPDRPSFSSAVACNRQAVEVARQALEELAAALRARNRVQARGVVLVNRLLTDPCSALYHPAEADELYEAARQALLALAPDPAIPGARERAGRSRGRGARAGPARRSRSLL